MEKGRHILGNEQYPCLECLEDIDGMPQICFHDKRIMPSVFPPGAIRLCPRCDPSQSGRMKMSRAGTPPIGEIPGTTKRVIRAVVV